MTERFANSARPYLSRRSLLRSAGALIGAGLPSAFAATARAQPAAPDKMMTVTLLGTGSPRPNITRFSAATLVQAGGMSMLFDAGRGCATRLGQIDVPLGSIKPLFITHFHSDHLVGMPDLWMTGYIQTSYAMRREPMLIIGPQGIRHIAEGMRDAFMADIRTRMADEKTPKIATEIETREFDEDGVVFEADGVKVAAFAVNHGPLIHPAYGFRVDYAGRSVLISGDTKFDEAVVRNGVGVDLLIHEVCDAPQDVLGKLQNRAVVEHHTSPEEAGTIFSRTKPKLAAYTHIIQLTARGATTTPDVAQIEAATRRTYSGPLVVGEDLMRFVIGEAVTVQRWDTARQAYSSPG